MGWLAVVAAFSTLNPITVSVYPPVSSAPATVVFTILATKHPGNREMCFEYDGPEKKGLCEPIRGEGGPRSVTFRWPIRTPGQYLATAKLKRIVEGEEQFYVNSQSFTITGPETSF